MTPIFSTFNLIMTVKNVCKRAFPKKLYDLKSSDPRTSYPAPNCFLDSTDQQIKLSIEIKLFLPDPKQTNWLLRKRGVHPVNHFLLITLPPHIYSWLG